MQQLPKLSARTQETLRGAKNLLAYSAGSDSNALFYTLLSYGIEFDIALVNYKTRKESDVEESYAKELAKRFNKQCFTLTCKLKNQNFEHFARVKRYEFFEQIMQQHHYKNLLTAHHLNDRLEWFFMQLGKGAGLVEMLGFEEIQEKNDYFIIRPFLETSKEEIELFLHVNNIKHFLDSSNEANRYKRNHIRHHYANSFLKEYKAGVLQSFQYLQEDVQRLKPKTKLHLKKLYILLKHEDDLLNIRGIDKVVKQLGYLLSKAQREEILRTKDCVIGKKIVVSFDEEYIFLAPFSKTKMEKNFKELCRINKIPQKIRAYLVDAGISPSEVRKLLS